MKEIISKYGYCAQQLEKIKKYAGLINEETIKMEMMWHNSEGLKVSKKDLEAYFVKEKEYISRLTEELDKQLNLNGTEEIEQYLELLAEQQKD